MEKTPLSQLNVRGNIHNPQSYYHYSSAVVAKIHPLAFPGRICCRSLEEVNPFCPAELVSISGTMQAPML